jgi:hypothetical protein
MFNRVHLRGAKSESLFGDGCTRRKSFAGRTGTAKQTATGRGRN